MIRTDSRVKEACTDEVTPFKVGVADYRLLEGHTFKVLTVEITVI
jgi:hypothetical protein